MNELQQSNGVRKFWKIIYYIGIIFAIPTVFLLIVMIRMSLQFNNGSDQGGPVVLVFFIISGFISLTLIIVSKIFLAKKHSFKPESETQEGK